MERNAGVLVPFRRMWPNSLSRCSMMSSNMCLHLVCAYRLAFEMCCGCRICRIFRRCRRWAIAMASIWWSDAGRVDRLYSIIALTVQLYNCILRWGETCFFASQSFHSDPKAWLASIMRCFMSALALSFVPSFLVVVCRHVDLFRVVDSVWSAVIHTLLAARQHADT